MTYSDKYLTPNTFYCHLSFEEFCKQIPNYYFKKEVPDDIIASFEVVKSLLAHSYYQYLFIDEAYSKSLRIFEMAMNIRLRDFENNIAKLTFHPLIHKLTALDLFDTNINVLLNVKDIRNHFSHPDRHSFGGVVYWNRIESVVMLINELYEDVNLRKERRLLHKEFVKIQKSLNLQNGLVLKTLETNKILYSLRLLLVNNKVTPYSYLLVGIPLFDLTSASPNGGLVPNVYEIKITEPKFKNGVLETRDFYTNQEITFFPLNNVTGFQPEYDAWSREYEKKMKIIYESGIGYAISDFFIRELLEFQKM